MSPRRRRASGGLVPVGETSHGGLLDTRRDLVVVSWNVNRGRAPGFRRELDDLVRDERVDVLALQEARPGLELPGGFGGHHATSYRLVGAQDPEGVLTAARATPLEALRMRSPSRELRVLTPKAALVTRYPLRSGDALTVVNVHGLNFDPRGTLLLQQLLELAAHVHAFDGPMVFTGDFNTWNEERRRSAHELAEGLGLVEVEPPGGAGRTGAAGPATVERALGLDRGLHLDRMYVRGLKPVRAAWLEECVASDHVPLLAQLAW